MNINGRLLLVLCAVALFVRVWSTNDRHRPVRSPRPAAVSKTIPRGPASPAKKLTAARPIGLIQGTVVDERPAAIAAEETWTAQTAPFELSPGLAAGTYRVVSDSGRVARLTIPASGERRECASSLDVLSISTATERWYLIRLKTERVANREVPAVGSSEPFPTAIDSMLVPSIPSTRPSVALSESLPAAAVESAPESLPESTPALQSAEETAEPVPATAPIIQQAERPAAPELPSPL